MKNSKNTVQAALGCLLLMIAATGCVAPTKTTEYQSVPLAKPADFALENKGAKAKVVVLDFKDGTADAARQASAGKTIHTQVQSVLGSLGTAQLVDRSEVPGLTEELRLAELQSNGTTSSAADNVNFAIYGEVANADTGSKFTETSSWTDDKGKTYVTPAKMTYTSNLTGMIKVARITAGGSEIVASIPLVGTAEFSEETRTPKEVKRNDGLVRTAAENAVKKVKYTLANVFTPEAYIIEHLVHPKSKVSLFKIEMGYSSGVAVGDKVLVYSTMVTRNELRGTTSRKRVLLGEGKVLDQLTANEAYIRLNDARIAAQIRMGDYVTIEKKGSFLERLQGMQ